jgi:bacteriorhodopsin
MDHFRRKIMPQNKRESLIYTVLMCFTMVLWMSIYNVALHMGGLSGHTLQEAWLGFPWPM